MWKEKTPKKISFDTVGMVVTGKIASIGRAGRLDVNTYTLVTEDDELISFLGTTVLDKVLSDELYSIVKIEYTGTEKTSGGFFVKQFKVFTLESDEPVDPIAPEPEVEA